MEANPYLRAIAPYNQNVTTNCNDKKGVPMFDLFWHDTYIDQSRLLNLKRYQRVNHFPGMVGITSKAMLSEIIRKMKNKYPEDYNFSPKCWNLPLH